MKSNIMFYITVKIKYPTSLGPNSGREENNLHLLATSLHHFHVYFKGCP